jgi:hypothetical protein
MKAHIKQRIVSSITILAIATLFGGLAVLAKPTKIVAADIDKGGSAIEAAVSITAGKYTGLPLAQDEETFYKITVKAGQELKVVARLKPAASSGTLNTVKIYNGDRKEVASEFDSSGSGVNTITVATLANSEKASQTYYIEIADSAWGVESGELDVTLTDCYDAESTTDAGQTIDTALAIKSGSHKGYLALGDTDDYYSVPAAAGKLSIKVTPNSKMTPTLEVYDQNRTLIAEQTAQNAGQIFTLSANVGQAGNVYLHFKCDSYDCSKTALDYTFATSATGSSNAATPESNTTTVPDKTNGTVVNNYTWIGLAAAAAVVAVIVIVYFARRKKPSVAGSAKQNGQAPAAPAASAAATKESKSAGTTAEPVKDESKK